MTKYVLHVPKPKAPRSEIPTRRNGIPAGYSLDELPERVREWRRKNVPVLSEEEDALMAEKQNRPRRVVRHSCGRTVFIGNVCWSCATLHGDHAPAVLPPLSATHVGNSSTDREATRRARQALRRQHEHGERQAPQSARVRGKRKR